MTSVILLSHTPEPEKLIALAAKNCYSDLKIKDLISKVDIKDTSQFIKMLFDVGHLSPFEHVNFTFGLSEVSRSTLAQLSRHRLCSLSVRSQRYVNHNNFNYIIPETIKNSKYLEKYKKITELIQEFYNEMKGDIPNDDRRYILPESCTTQIIWSCNARELLHVFSLRCCNLASREIRNLVDKILYIVKDVAPTIFENAGPKCLHNGKCNEGKRTCGKFLEVKEKYADLDKYYNEMT